MPVSQRHNYSLRTTPIPPHSAPVTARPHKPIGKVSRPPGDPSSAPKPYPRFIPPPPTNLNNLTLPLEVILPDEAKAAVDAGVLIFHSVGDTGGIHGDDVEKTISDAMDKQISDANSAKTLAPAFYYNLGDVVYFNGQIFAISETGQISTALAGVYQPDPGAVLTIGGHDVALPMTVGRSAGPRDSKYIRQRPSSSRVTVGARTRRLIVGTSGRGASLIPSSTVKSSPFAETALRM